MITSYFNYQTRSYNHQSKILNIFIIEENLNLSQ